VWHNVALSRYLASLLISLSSISAWRITLSRYLASLPISLSCISARRIRRRTPLDVLTYKAGVTYECGWHNVAGGGLPCAESLLVAVRPCPEGAWPCPEARYIRICTLRICGISVYILAAIYGPSLSLSSISLYGPTCRAALPRSAARGRGRDRGRAPQYSQVRCMAEAALPSTVRYAVWPRPHSAAQSGTRVSESLRPLCSALEWAIH
jgi:hypothetical protein